MEWEGSGRAAQGHTGGRGSSAFTPTPAGSGPLLPPPGPSSLTQGLWAAAQSLQEAGLGLSVQSTLRGFAWGRALLPGLVLAAGGRAGRERGQPHREETLRGTGVCACVGSTFVCPCGLRMSCVYP